MSKEKAPAFQFYPKDWDTDVNVIPMTYEEEGVYWALCRMVWLNGSVTANLDDLRLLLKGRPSIRQMERWWTRVGRCFEVRDGLLFHRRLDRERTAQAESRERRTGAARKRWDKESNADAMHIQSNATNDAKQCSASSSASPSSSPTATAVNTPPLVSGESHPRNWGKIHSDHVAGFCDWVCLPDFIFSEFARKSQDTYVRDWARGVRCKWEGEKIGDNLKFWRARWDESHPEKAEKPKAEPFSIEKAIAREAARKAGIQ